MFSATIDHEALTFRSLNLSIRITQNTIQISDHSLLSTIQWNKINVFVTYAIRHWSRLKESTFGRRECAKSSWPRQDRESRLLGCSSSSWLLWPYTGVTWIQRSWLFHANSTKCDWCKRFENFCAVWANHEFRRRHQQRQGIWQKKDGIEDCYGGARIISL